MLIDGQDIRDVAKENLREAMALVPQDISLFHRTVRENLCYGRPNCTEAEMLAAAETARCREFIEALPEGFDTMVGDRGVMLSGGQRQRLAIARALLKDAPILLLDEATSALDTESEQLIQAALEDLMHGRTVIAIAHRLSTLRDFDRIIVMDRGQIVDDGAPSVLARRPGPCATCSTASTWMSDWISISEPPETWRRIAPQRRPGAGVGLEVQCGIPGSPRSHQSPAKAAMPSRAGPRRKCSSGPCCLQPL